MGGKADHLAQKVGVGGLLYQCAQGHHVVGHRSVLGSGRGFANPTLYRRSTMTAAKPLARYGAIEGRARERLPTAEATTTTRDVTDFGVPRALVRVANPLNPNQQASN